MKAAAAEGPSEGISSRTSRAVVADKAGDVGGVLPV